MGPFALGEGFSIVDPYLFVMLAWARFIQLPLSELGALTEWMGRMLARPSVRTTLHSEGLLDEHGRPTAPSAA